MFLLISLIFSIVFDTEHCKRKCESLFGDSPSKRSLCLGTCMNGFSEQREKISYGRRQQTKSDVATCLVKCSENMTADTKFTHWLKCRKSCLIISPESEDLNFFAPERCGSECDRCWKGTVHWRPCIDHCSQFTTNKRPVTMTPLPLKTPEKDIIFSIW